MADNVKDICNIFFDLEYKYKLNFLEIQGTYPWQLIRIFLYYHITGKKKLFGSAQQQNLSLFDKIKSFIPFIKNSVLYNPLKGNEEKYLPGFFKHLREYVDGFIVLDDCSTDDTAEVLKPYLKKYPNMHYYILPQNGGPAVARTEAIRRATGKYIAFLDSDDLWKPDKMEKQIAFMERTGAKFSATGYGWMDEEGNDLHTVFIPPKKTDYKKMIRLSNPIGNLSVMYDQEALGKFEVPPIKKRNDFALWLKILKKTDYCYGMEEVLGTYRMGRAGSVSSNKLKQAKYHWQLYHEIEGHNVVRSLYELGCWAWVKGTGIGIDKRKV